MNRMDLLEGMRVFVAVIETGSFSAAARRMRVQQSTISRTVTALEEHYDAILLRRTTRKMTLTEAGHTFLVDGRRILADLGTLEARMTRLHDEPEGVLRISLSTAFGKLVIVPLLADLKERYPKLLLEIHHEDRLVDIIAEGYDVVIRIGAGEDSLVTSRRIAIVRRGLFVAHSLVKKLGPIATPDDLARYPALILGDQMPASARWQLVRGKTRANVPIASVTTVDHLDSLHVMLDQGLGVAFAPTFVADAAPGRRPLVRVLEDWNVVHRLDPSSGVFALFPGGGKSTAKVRVFVDFLVERLRDWNR